MVDREIIKEHHTSESGSNLLVGVIVIILLGVIIYFIVNGGLGVRTTPEPSNGEIDINLNTDPNINLTGQ